MQELLGNKTEEAVQAFLDLLDKNSELGPKPISGVTFKENYIADVLECNDEVAKELFAKPSPFLFDEYDQVYIDVLNEDTNTQERLYITSETKDPSFQLICEKIGSCLPEITYDVECGGYPSRQTEAASLYKIAVVNRLQEGQYEKEIRAILEGYDCIDLM